MSFGDTRGYKGYGICFKPLTDKGVLLYCNKIMVGFLPSKSILCGHNVQLSLWEEVNKAIHYLCKGTIAGV